jgi:hypothetical protein
VNIQTLINTEPKAEANEEMSDAVVEGRRWGGRKKERRVDRGDRVQMCGLVELGLRAW